MDCVARWPGWLEMAKALITSGVWCDHQYGAEEKMLVHGQVISSCGRVALGPGYLKLAYLGYLGVPTIMDNSHSGGTP
jgi:hypothetical protein